jgi:transposase
MSDGTHLTATVRERIAPAAFNGLGISRVAAAYGVGQKTVPGWITKYSDYGGAAFERKVGGGRPRKLEELSEDELASIDLQQAIAFGFETDLWTVSRLRRVIQHEFRIQRSRNTI